MVADPGEQKSVTGRRFAWWLGYFAASYEAPPVGFEPTLTAPEAVGIRPPRCV